MTPAVEKIRAMLSRALTEAEEEGDLKSALDISRMLLPLEQRIEEEEREAADAKPALYPGVYDMPQSALDLAQDLLSRQVAGETLSDRELGRLDVLYTAMAGRLILPPDRAGEPGLSAEGVTLAGPEEPALDRLDHPSGQLEEATRPEPEPEPVCPTCRLVFTGCAETKEGRPDVWRVLHHDHPDEVERRRQEATAVMMRQVGRPLPDWYR